MCPLRVAKIKARGSHFVLFGAFARAPAHPFVHAALSPRASAHAVNNSFITRDKLERRFPLSSEFQSLIPRGGAAARAISIFRSSAREIPGSLAATAAEIARAGRSQSRPVTATGNNGTVASRKYPRALFIISELQLVAGRRSARARARAALPVKTSAHFSSTSAAPARRCRLFLLATREKGNAQRPPARVLSRECPLRLLSSPRRASARDIDRVAVASVMYRP